MPLSRLVFYSHLSYSLQNHFPLLLLWLNLSGQLLFRIHGDRRDVHDRQVSASEKLGSAPGVGRRYRKTEPSSVLPNVIARPLGHVSLLLVGCPL